MEVTDPGIIQMYIISGGIYSNNQDVSIVRKACHWAVSLVMYLKVSTLRLAISNTDLNNNNIFDPGDRTIIGNAQPDFCIRAHQQFSWKGFDLNIFIQGSYGNDIFNATRIDLEGMFDGKNQSVAVLNRWTPTTELRIYPDVSNGNVQNVLNSTRFEDGSYVVKSVT